MKLEAKWIWKRTDDCDAYNQVVIARKDVTLPAVRQATLHITADTFYRLYINGRWINDGPARAWPEHYLYDSIDVTGELRPGLNRIDVIVRYFGAGDFHHVPRQGGLLVQLDIVGADGKKRVVRSDKTWEFADASQWIRPTAKISCQLPPQELVDSRQGSQGRFSKAIELFDAGGGPWQDLQARPIPLLSRTPLSFKTFCGASVVQRDRDPHFVVPIVRLMHPGLIEANRNTASACGIATMIRVPKRSRVQIQHDGIAFTVDGRHEPEGVYTLAAGNHLLLGFVVEPCSHNKERFVRFVNPPAMRLTNPLEARHENPWCFIPLPEFSPAKTDMLWPERATDGQLEDTLRQYKETRLRLASQIVDREQFLRLLGSRAKNLPASEMFVQDAGYWQFQNRRVLAPADGLRKWHGRLAHASQGHLAPGATGQSAGKTPVAHMATMAMPRGYADGLVDCPAALMHDNGDVTTVHPSRDGDIELIYDLGEQSCGYYDFELTADAGVIVDLYGVEYIKTDGTVQHTWGNRNGMRYLTSAGANRFTSLMRRSGRYVFLTLRNVTSPVKIRSLRLIESTYPVQYEGGFHCSDARLDEIWDISARTLKLCMEDSFTDCPLYEQTLWVGDARNESLFAYGTFGAADLAERCIEIIAQSLERFPMVGCQVPSGWDCILPAWSFLWGISVWDYYFHTGDLAFLRKLWPAVMKNLRGAAACRDERGLFSAPLWNLFDWSGADQNHNTVTHNTMLVVGAIDAARRCAAVLGKLADAGWLAGLRAEFCRAAESVWDARRGAYRDGFHEDGAISDVSCQHTSFLSVLYDVASTKRLPALVRNMLQPPAGMVPVGSPFAIQYLYEALDKIGRRDRILQSIYDLYLPMLQAGATTVWEVFPTFSKDRPPQFPTRSHCHAWSSAPVYFLNRIILGIRQTSPAGKAFDISPELSGLTWAAGSVATAQGTVRVAWRIEDQGKGKTTAGARTRTGRGTKTLYVKISAPPGVETRFVRNPTHKGLKILMEN